MRQLIEYLRFLLKSKNKHGVHSPFVFKLLTSSLSVGNVLKEDWVFFKKIKKEFYKDDLLIEVTDFGAGSKKLKNNYRSISLIAKNVGISNKRAKILYQLVNYLEPKNILEIGTSIGLSTSILSIASKSSNIITLEGCPNTLKLAEKMFLKNGLNNIVVKLGKFDNTLSTVLNDSKFDFVYVDGNHSKEATIEYFEMLLKSVNNDSCLVFDDIYWSKGMTEAWNYIYNHPSVTVSIDTFQWGIVFFRKEQEKEHFVLRV